jgi:hypothetical protein
VQTVSYIPRQTADLRGVTRYYSDGGNLIFTAHGTSLSNAIIIVSQKEMKRLGMITQYAQIHHISLNDDRLNSYVRANIGVALDETSIQQLASIKVPVDPTIAKPTDGKPLYGEVGSYLEKGIDGLYRVHLENIGKELVHSQPSITDSHGKIIKKTSGPYTNNDPTIVGHQTTVDIRIHSHQTSNDRTFNAYNSAGKKSDSHGHLIDDIRTTHISADKLGKDGPSDVDTGSYRSLRPFDIVTERGNIYIYNDQGTIAKIPFLNN